MALNFNECKRNALNVKLLLSLEQFLLNIGKHDAKNLYRNKKCF